MTASLLGALACLIAILFLRPRQNPETPQQAWNAWNEIRHSARELQAHTGWRWLKWVQQVAEEAQKKIADRRRDGGSQ